jgi:hypothetical protein
VHFRAGEGLFGDLHFNPKHALSEQLIWDAEHAPQNVGMSHNVLARTSLDGGNTVVEAITKVQSIDLVADPATTSGLFEQIGESGIEEQRSGGVASQAKPSSTTPFATLTLDELRRHRPDLIREATLDLEQQFQQARVQLDALIASNEASQRRERILQLLQEHGLPLPANDGPPSHIVSERFIDSLLATTDERLVQRLIQERAELVRSASLWHGNSRSIDRRPRSKDQVQLTFDFASDPVRSGQEFANAVRGS